MNTFSQTTKGMLGIGILLLAGCSSAPTLEFTIPKDKLTAFNACLVPNDLNELGKNNDNKFWLSGLGEFVPVDLREQGSLASLAGSLPKILNLHYGDITKLAVPEGGQMLRVPFDMHIQRFPFIDSKMVDIIEELLHTANISPLLQLDQQQNNNAIANSQKNVTTKSGRIAKALNAYLLAYFTIHPDKRGAAGFVSRDGTKFQFPVQIGSGIQAINTVDHSQVGADVIRIILEAIRDGSLDDCAALPGIDQSATGVVSGLLKDFKNNASDPCVKKWKLTSMDDFNEIQVRANAAESIMATAAGKAIRGGLIGSLNNEALARAVETATGVIARHTTERVEWCKTSVK